MLSTNSSNDKEEGAAVHTQLNPFEYVSARRVIIFLFWRLPHVSKSSLRIFIWSSIRIFGDDLQKEGHHFFLTC